jgi:hypothetical protein
MFTNKVSGHFQKIHLSEHREQFGNRGNLRKDKHKPGKIASAMGCSPHSFLHVQTLNFPV